jgi:hypothetical protein
MGLAALALGTLGVLAATPGGAAVPNGIAKKSPNDIVKTSVATLRKAPSYRVVGSVTDSGTLTTLDLSVSSGSAKGNVTVGGDTIHLLRKGDTIYFSANKQFWDQQVGAGAGNLFGSRWVMGKPTDEGFSSFSSFLDPQQLAKGLTDQTGSVNGTITKTKNKSINGQPVVELSGQNSAKNASGIWAVASTGAPYLIRVSITGSTSGTITFSNFGKAVKVNTPKDALNFSQLSKLGQSSSS